MDIWQLNIFCKVIELKSFSKAAEAVHISQPTVSSHIKFLEDAFGTRLIDRLPKEVLPTKAGEILFGYGKRMIALKEEAESALAEFQGSIRGRLRVGGSNIPGVYLLPRIVGGFKRAHPGIGLSLTIGDTAEIIRGVADGEIELGIVGALSGAKNLTQEVIVEDELCLVVPTAHPFGAVGKITMDLLLQEPFIVREAGSGTLKSIQASLESRGVRLDRLNIVAEMGNTAAVLQGVKSGVGVSILSRIAADEDIAAGKLKALAIENLNLKRHFYLTQHRLRSLSPIGRSFIDFLKETL